jgi:hypothetical protein
VGAERDDYLLWNADDPSLLHPRDGRGVGRHARFARWLEVELLATEAHAALGVVPRRRCGRVP